MMVKMLSQNVYLSVFKKKLSLSVRQIKCHTYAHSFQSPIHKVHLLLLLIPYKMAQSYRGIIKMLHLSIVVNFILLNRKSGLTEQMFTVLDRLFDFSLRLRVKILLLGCMFLFISLLLSLNWNS